MVGELVRGNTDRVLYNDVTSKRKIGALQSYIVTPAECLL
jgi:hypothetical protein